MKILHFLLFIVLISCEVKEIGDNQSDCKLVGSLREHYNVCPDRQNGLRISKILNTDNAVSIVNFERYDIDLADYSIHNEKTLRDNETGMRLGNIVKAGESYGFYNHNSFFEVLSNARKRKLFLVDKGGTVVDEFKWPQY